jgi:hypothetical protein
MANGYVLEFKILIEKHLKDTDGSFFSRSQSYQVSFSEKVQSNKLLIICSRLGLDGAGWSKQENEVVMPDATLTAGVVMRLEAGGYRELHWHVAAEWSLVLNGSCRIQVQSCSPGCDTFCYSITIIA